MRMELIASSRVPYGGAYVITDPVTKVKVSGSNLKTVLRGVYDERRANGAPCGLDLEGEVEQWICQAYPSECQSVDPKVFRHKPLAISHIVAGSRVMLSQWFNGRKVVAREEAERRAQICVNCPMNVKFEKPCGGLCPQLAEVVSGITGAQGTQYDWQLNSCAICKCFLQAAIWVERDTQWNVLDETTKEQFNAINYPCWKRPEA